MRKIKFRIFDNTLKEFITTYDNQEILIGLDGKLHSNMGILKDEYFKLDQFTGLYDKNNLPIFESDILKRDEISFDLNIVEFKDGMFGWYDKLCEDFTVIAGWEPERRLEIIGNIHENGDLLCKNS
jgi:hypothetical protein